MIDLDALEHNARGYPVVSLPPEAFFALIQAVRSAVEMVNYWEPRQGGGGIFTNDFIEALAPFRKSPLTTSDS